MTTDESVACELCGKSGAELRPVVQRKGATARVCETCAMWLGYAASWRRRSSSITVVASSTPPVSAARSGTTSGSQTDENGSGRVRANHAAPSSHPAAALFPGVRASLAHPRGRCGGHDRLSLCHFSSQQPDLRVRRTSGLRESRVPLGPPSGGPCMRRQYGGRPAKVVVVDLQSNCRPSTVRPTPS